MKVHWFRKRAHVSGFKGSPERWTITKRPYSIIEGPLVRLSAVNTIASRLKDVRIEEFREIAYLPQLPLLIKSSGNGTTTSDDVPPLAAVKWFPQNLADQGGRHSTASQRAVLSVYLLQFGAAIVPYELFIDSSIDIRRQTRSFEDISPFMFDAISSILGPLHKLKTGSFHTFNAPLSLFFEICKAEAVHPLLKMLYVAQAPVSDLPSQLQDDLATPVIVREAGKGDIYDANLWLGLPPTYTPLHKDPNPNLFLQLAGSKRVRLFGPKTGAAVFHYVQDRIRQTSSVRFRGREMMEGPERSALDDAVWSQVLTGDGFEATVNGGDALFIPRGWWHSLKSTGRDVTASVNWWFR